MGRGGKEGGGGGWQRMGGEEARALQGHLGTQNGGNTGLCVAASTGPAVFEYGTVTILDDIRIDLRSAL